MVGNRYRWLIEPWMGWLPLISLGLFVLVELTQLAGLSWPFVHWYLNDLICIPVFVAASISLERLLSGKHQLKYGIFKVLAWLIIVSIVFEWYLPISSVKYTSDLYDLVFYAIGTWLVYCFSPCIARTKSSEKAY